MGTESRRATAWQQFVETLSPEGRQALAGAGATHSYAAWSEELSAGARAAVASLAAQRPGPPAPEPPLEAPAGAQHYFMVEIPNNGDWPTVKHFDMAEDMARYIHKIDGEDTTVFPFYGVQLILTKGPQRYLRLPNQVDAVMVPMADELAPLLVDFALLAGAEVEPEYFLGDSRLAESDRKAGIHQMRPRVKLRRPAMPSGPIIGSDEDEGDSDPDEGLASAPE